mgnify:CR=1 FL=1
MNEENNNILGLFLGSPFGTFLGVSVLSFSISFSITMYRKLKFKNTLKKYTKSGIEYIQPSHQFYHYKGRMSSTTRRTNTLMRFITSFTGTVDDRATIQEDIQEYIEHHQDGNGNIGKEVSLAGVIPKSRNSRSSMVDVGSQVCQDIISKRESPKYHINQEATSTIKNSIYRN